jgi:predicted anti-sigma-YlaC factor YlaD
MKCKDAEKRLLRSFDGELEGAVKADLDSHLEACPDCRRKQSEYSVLLKNLKVEDAEPLPYFWERLETKLRERERGEPWSIWAQWSRKVIPVSLALIVLFVGALAIFSPAAEEELSQPAALLLQNVNPLIETKTLFDAEKLEDKGLVIIFAADEKTSERRQRP